MSATLRWRVLICAVFIIDKLPLWVILRVGWIPSTRYVVVVRLLGEEAL
jgi:hypothetical protein